VSSPANRAASYVFPSTKRSGFVARGTSTPTSLSIMAPGSEPALPGLERASTGRASIHEPTARRFLGWTVGKHWLLRS
jgi:hypothetical protein